MSNTNTTANYPQNPPNPAGGKRDGNMVSDVTTVDLKNWMWNNYELLKDRLIYRIALPGTHNSGVAGKNVTIGFRTQDTTIGTQLNGGIRYFDMRVGKPRNNANFWFWHNEAYSTLQTYQQALDDIRNFLDANRGEIIVIELSWANGSDNDKNEALKILKEKFDSYLYPQAEAKTATVKNIIDSGRRLIVNFDSAGDDQSIWKGSFCSSYHGSWQDAGDGRWAKTLSYRYDHFWKSNLLGLFNGNSNNNGAERASKKFYKIDLSFWDLDIKKGANYGHKMMDEIYNGAICARGDSWPLASTYIYLIDFFEFRDFGRDKRGDFVRQVIDLNGLPYFGTDSSPD